MMHSLIPLALRTGCAAAAALFVSGAAVAQNQPGAAPSAGAERSRPESTDAAASELRELRAAIEQIRQAYEARIRALEQRLERAQAGADATPASPAPDQPHQVDQPHQADQGSPAVAPSDGALAASPVGRFNPSVSLLLSGRYAHLSRDPADWRLSGFIPGGAEIGPGERGFSLGESELTLRASVDPWFDGALTLALGSDDTVGVEEGYVQTTALGGGVTVKAGRFFSGLGYLNEQHAHAWDFIDAPLAYQAFLGGQFAQDGLQAQWLLPIDQFVALGAEVGQGGTFPGGGGDRNRPGAWALYAHTGGDIGDSQSWRLGLSGLWAQPQAREFDDLDAFGATVTNGFSGRSRVVVLDGVWKWAPNGNARSTGVKLQGEYFRRVERGTLVYDVASTASADAYRSAQSGWYVQGVYRFLPEWRAGLRVERLDPGSVDFGANAAALAVSAYEPSRLSALLEWSPSEFSRVSLQWARDRSTQAQPFNAFFIQYQMSLGAHGAHGY